MPIAPIRSNQRRAVPRNGDFANAVRGFVKRALALPGMPYLGVVSVAAALVAPLVAAFGTGAIDPLPRLAFWIVLMAINYAKWQLWFAVTIRRAADWRWSPAVAAVLLNLALPVEIALCLSLVGVETDVAMGATLARALAISGVIFLVIVTFPRKPSATAATPALDAPTLPPLLMRAGIRHAAELRAIEAEDHYCRLHLAGGRSVLVHHRFGDALSQVAALDGGQVHRGAWVAASAVQGAVRDGRRWRLVLDHELSLPVSNRFVPAVRARGWLRPRPG